MSKVTDGMETAVFLVSKPKGAFDYNKGQIWARFNYNLNHMDNSIMNEEDNVKMLAAKYLDAELTSKMCLHIMDIINLQEAVTSYQDSDVLGPIETQYNSGILNEKSQTIMQLITKAKEQIKNDVFLAYKHQTIDEFDSKGNPRTKEDKVAGLIAFGLSPDEAKRYQWSGNGVMDLSGRQIDFYALAGILTE
jgi:hypothetical protein